MSRVSVTNQQNNICQADSPTLAGGVALYVSKALTSFPRTDVTLDMPLVESVWVEIATPQNIKTILVGCIYKHPGANIDEFNGKIDETMKLFNPNKYQLYILGDMNIDDFKCDSHPPTEAYLDMLYSNNLLPIITKPTRLTYHSATLIDYIYTNSTSKIVSGIVSGIVSLITSQLSVTNIPVKKHNPIKYYRDYSNFDQESYLLDINTVLTPASRIHNHNPRFVSNLNYFRLRVSTNLGKTSFKFSAPKIWETVPPGLKCLAYYKFKKEWKYYLLTNQI